MPIKNKFQVAYLDEYRNQSQHNFRAVKSTIQRMLDEGHDRKAVSVQNNEQSNILSQEIQAVSVIVQRHNKTLNALHEVMQQNAEKQSLLEVGMNDLQDNHAQLEVEFLQLESDLVERNAKSRDRISLNYETIQLIMENYLSVRKHVDSLDALVDDTRVRPVKYGTK